MNESWNHLEVLTGTLKWKQPLRRKQELIGKSILKYFLKNYVDVINFMVLDENRDNLKALKPGMEPSCSISFRIN